MALTQEIQKHLLDGAVYEQGTGWCWRDRVGQLHRTDGPAWLNLDGYCEWRIHGRRHRADGPAITMVDGEHEWWVHGQDITAEVEAWMASNDITWPFTPEQQAEFALRWT